MYKSKSSENFEELQNIVKVCKEIIHRLFNYECKRYNLHNTLASAKILYNDESNSLKFKEKIIFNSIIVSLKEANRKKILLISKENDDDIKRFQSFLDYIHDLRNKIYHSSFNVISNEDILQHLDKTEQYFGLINKGYPKLVKTSHFKLFDQIRYLVNKKIVLSKNKLIKQEIIILDGKVIKSDKIKFEDLKL